jgi:hypothetical protein
MQYEVINLDTDKSHGVYDSFEQARGCVRFDRLRAYQIWAGTKGEDGELYGQVRVENCEPYDGDDGRARQGLGEE